MYGWAGIKPPITSTCPDCGGHGYFQAGEITIECDRCLGKGKIETSSYLGFIWTSILICSIVFLLLIIWAVLSVTG